LARNEVDEIVPLFTNRETHELEPCEVMVVMVI
jgi:hypothetical protein